jgi:tetratricopeptide (TPR) repeat protein
MQNYKHPSKHNQKTVHIQRISNHSLHHPNSQKKQKRTLILLVLLALFFCLSIWGAWKYYAYHTKKVSEDNYAQGIKNLIDGNFSEAEKSLEKSIKNGNEATEALLKLGVSKYNQKDYTGAIESYLKVLEKDPLNTIAGNSLGNVYRDKKDFEKAKEQYEKTIQIDSSFAPAYANLSIMLLDLDQKKEALDVVQNGLEKIPASIELKNIKTLLRPEE